MTTPTTGNGPDDLLGDLVGGVLDLLNMPADDPRRDELEGRLLDLCEMALGMPPSPEPAPAQSLPDDDRQAWIRALRADGMSMRAVARELHLAPSTVSRRLRRAAPKS